MFGTDEFLYFDPQLFWKKFLAWSHLLPKKTAKHCFNKKGYQVLVDQRERQQQSYTFSPLETVWSTTKKDALLSFEERLVKCLVTDCIKSYLSLSQKDLSPIFDESYGLLPCAALLTICYFTSTRQLYCPQSTSAKLDAFQQCILQTDQCSA